MPFSDSASPSSRMRTTVASMDVVPVGIDDDGRLAGDGARELGAKPRRQQRVVFAVEPQNRDAGNGGEAGHGL